MPFGTFEGDVTYRVAFCAAKIVPVYSETHWKHKDFVYTRHQYCPSRNTQWPHNGRSYDGVVDKTKHVKQIGQIV